MVFLPNIFKIKVDRITHEGLKETRELASNFINEKDLHFKDPVEVSVFIRKVGEDITVEGTIKVTLVCSCARCLEEFDLSVERDKYFAYFKKPAEENIDLTDSIREDIIISLPMRAICSEKCKGLCPYCGQNLNEKQCECKKPELPAIPSVFDSLGDVFKEKE
ncbi:MAG: DUF177 domain-containing protein [Candidatus Auribacterota bacterium]|nr:DUF177 domain-containing protein [Candidatus Auribacterota bacterium]